MYYYPLCNLIRSTELGDMHPPPPIQLVIGVFSLIFLFENVLTPIKYLLFLRIQAAFAIFKRASKKMCIYKKQQHKNHIISMKILLNKITP